MTKAANEVWLFGKAVETMSDAELKVKAARAWDANEGEALRILRAEGARRKVQVA